MRNVAITLKYLGTAYHGWQVQKTQVTVGETVEKRGDGGGPSRCM